MVLADSRRLSRIRRYSGNLIGGVVRFVYRALTCCGATFQNASTRHQLCNSVMDLVLHPLVPQPRTGNATRLYHQLGLGCSRFARRYSGSRCCFLLLGVLRCFNSPGSLYPPYVFRRESHPITGAGFPPSDIHGSKLGRQLPVAFRSHPRPSSASGAKASTVGSL